MTTKSRIHELDQAERKLRACLRDIDSVRRHLARAKIGARHAIFLGAMVPAMTHAADALLEVLRKWSAARAAKERT